MILQQAIKVLEVSNKSNITDKTWWNITKSFLNRKLIILASIHKDLDKIDSISLKLSTRSEILC